MSRWDAEQEARRDAEKTAALDEFHRHSHYLGFGGRYRTVVGRRLGEAFDAVSRWRVLSGQGCHFGDADAIALAARVTTSTVADQIAAAAGPNQDSATIAWVAAGLRCPSQPFCTGCIACQTVTSPLRPAEPLPRGPFD